VRLRSRARSACRRAPGGPSRLWAYRACGPRESRGDAASPARTVLVRGLPVIVENPLDLSPIRWLQRPASLRIARPDLASIGACSSIDACSLQSWRGITRYPPLTADPPIGKPAPFPARWPPGVQGVREGDREELVGWRWFFVHNCRTPRRRRRLRSSMSGRRPCRRRGRPLSCCALARACPHKAQGRSQKIVSRSTWCSYPSVEGSRAGTGCRGRPALDIWFLVATGGSVGPAGASVGASRSDRAARLRCLATQGGSCWRVRV